jgi:predicted phage terminase large subunit-like protein
VPRVINLHASLSDVSTAPAITALRAARGIYGAAGPRAADTARLSLREFCLRYLPHHFSKPFSEMHDDIFAACDALGPRPSRSRIARIAPRKFGKTTVISLGLPLQKLAYQDRFFILLLGESSTTAEANLATIAHELETNHQLADDFPHMIPAMDHKGQLVKWTDRQIVVSSFQTVMAKGMGARMRGVKYRQMRPDLAIIHDPESPETADTFLKRRRKKMWFGGTFMGLGADDWDIVALGNLPHHDCLIAGLVKSPEWDGKLWRAENLPRRDHEPYPLGNTKTDGSALWPDGWSLEALEAYRSEPNVGDLGYAREMLNDPRDDASKVFNVDQFTFFDFTPASLSGYVTTRTWMDPAGGQQSGEFRRGKRDYCAIVSAGRTRDGFIEVFDVRLTRELPDRQLDLLLDVYASFGTRSLHVEENQYKNLIGNLLMDKARRRSLYPTVRPEPRSGTQNKMTRILGIQPLIKAGIVRFARHLIEAEPEFFSQFDQFPSDFDDGPDATEGVISTLDVGRAQTFAHIISVGSASYWRSAGVS